MISKYIKGNKTGRVIVGIIISSVLLFLVLNLLISFIVDGIIKPKQLSKINSSEEIQLDIENISYSLFTNSFTLNNISLTHSAESESGEDSLRITISSVSTEINLMHLMFSDGYKFSGIYINDPLIRRFTSPIAGTSAGSKISDNNIFNFLDTLSRDLHYFSSGMIKINKGIYVNKNMHTGLSDSVINFNITLNDILFDSTNTGQLKLKVTEEIRLSAEKAIFHLGDMQYKLSLTDLNMDSDNAQLSLSNIFFGPYLNDDDFFKTKQYRVDRFILEINQIDFNELDFRDIIHNQVITIGNIVIDEYMLDALTNMRLPTDPSASPPKMPNEIVNEIPFSLNINKTELKNGNIYVKELYPYDNNPGVLLLGNLYSTISNIRSNETANFKIKTKLTGSGDLDFSFNLGLAPGKLKFDYSGTLGSMSADDLNEFIVISDRVKVNSGSIEQVKFSVDAFGDSAMAQAVPFYNNLSISELDDETGRSTGIMEQFNSFIANTFLIRKNNPVDDELKKSSVVYVRKEDDAFLEYVWIALRKAVGDVVGFN
ncbi:MAG: hypothetical protein R6W90_05590 [Ignavibacteriaceae bacterium]